MDKFFYEINKREKRSEKSKKENREVCWGEREREEVEEVGDGFRSMIKTIVCLFIYKN